MVTVLVCIVQPGHFFTIKIFYMEVVIIIAEVLALIILVVVAYIMTLAWKSRKVAIQTVKEGIDSLNSSPGIPEPDTLIETWQEGYIIGLKTYLEKLLAFQLRTHSRIVMHQVMQKDIDFINDFRVVKEMGLTFFLNEADAKHRSVYIYVHDTNTKRQWETKPYHHDKIEPNDL